MSNVKCFAKELENEMGRYPLLFLLVLGICRSKFDFGSCAAIEQVSNKFYFTFSVHPEAVKDGVRIRNVVPATEEEALRVIERMDAENSQIAAS